MKRGPALKSRGGFSLLELIVVLVIIGVMAAFVGPRLTGSMGNMNLKTASKRIAAILRYARSQAVSEGMDCVVGFDLQGNRVTVTFPKPVSEKTEGDKDGPGPDPDHDGRAQRAKVYSLPEGVFLREGISADGETASEVFEITFLSDGGSTGGEVVLVNRRERAYTVTVDFITGAVRVERHEA